MGSPHPESTAFEFNREARETNILRRLASWVMKCMSCKTVHTCDIHVAICRQAPALRPRCIGALVMVMHWCPMMKSHACSADTPRNNNVIITSIWCRDVVLTQ